MRKSYRNKTKRRGGAATAYPLKYFNAHAPEPEASSGRDLLQAIPPIGVRPRIGGSRKTRRILRKKGGFVPSVMDGFVAAASHYIVPIALFAGYKLMTRKGKKATRRYTKRR
jgi:hypothetical protein